MAYAKYQQIEVPIMYIEEFARLLGFIKNNYDWKRHEHPVFISQIGSVGITDVCKGRTGDNHQIFRGIILKVDKNLPGRKMKELEEIMESSLQ